jgi:CRISPR-associated protein Cas2
MRQAYIVTYDICDPRRLRAVFKLMKGYGEHLQLSVFQCELNPTERVELEARLCGLIHHIEDQILFIDIGPAETRGRRAIESLGKPYRPPDTEPIVI